MLLHGGTASARTWRDVIPLLSDRYHVYSPSLLGHRGGPAPHRRPVTANDIVDWAAGYLDENDLARPHLAGHSLGGYVAIELARRGRAASVCAMSPGGFWGTGDGLRARTMGKVAKSKGPARAIRPFLPIILKPAWVRRLWFSSGAVHGDRVTVERGVEIFDDFLGCTVMREVFNSDDQQVATFDSLACPVTVAWAEKDKILPLDDYGPIVRKRLPQATFEVMPGVGHDPTMDAPDLVAQTILRVAGAVDAV